MIRSVTLRITGGPGPSRIDSHGLKHLCTSLRRASSELCNSIALVARRICTTFVDPKGLASLLTSRLIALDKSPGIRPIGIGETVHHVIGKAILRVIKHNIQDATGSMHLRAGQETECEAAVHAMNRIVGEVDAEGVLLVDAANTFNCLN